jgi:predicted alpha/beta hydrolase family esterase
VGDTYVDVRRYVTNHAGAKFVYVPIPNNNSGDLGNTTIEECVDYVVHQYNQICRNHDIQDTIILAGHSMGGIVVTRMISGSCIQRLYRRPDFVRLVNPALHVPLTVPVRLVTTICHYFVPTGICSYVSMPSPISKRNQLYPKSPAVAHAVKPLLLLSALSGTGRLYFNNHMLDLEPDVDMCARIIIIACRDDPLGTFGHLRLVASKYNIRIVTVASGYHTFFDNTVMTSFFDRT